MRGVAGNLHAEFVCHMAGGVADVDQLVGGALRRRHVMRAERDADRAVAARVERAGVGRQKTAVAADRDLHEIGGLLERFILQVLVHKAHDLLPHDNGGIGVGIRHGKIAVGTPAKTLFGGLMTCPHCGGSVIAVNSRKYGCANRKDRGPAVCPGIMFSREDADKQLMTILKRSIISPDSQQELERQVREIIAETQKSAQITNRNKQKRLSELDGEINRLVDAVATVGISDALRMRLHAAESERERLQSEIECTTPVVKLVQKTTISDQIKKIMNNLHAALQKDTKRARQIISELFGEIKIIDSEDALYVEYDNATQKLLIACGGVSRNMVAGAGFEPTTFGL